MGPAPAELRAARRRCSRRARRSADIGSGAGLPGLVLAIARPDLQVTLVEPLLRRTTFLDEVVERARAWTTSRWSAAGPRSCTARRRFDVVTSRAVAPLAELLGWSLPLVAAAGALLAMKGSSAPEEIEAAAPELARLAAPGRRCCGRAVPGSSADHGGPGGPAIPRAGIGWPRRRSARRSAAKGTRGDSGRDRGRRSGATRSRSGLAGAGPDGGSADRRFPPVWGGPLSVTIHRRTPVHPQAR